MAVTDITTENFEAEVLKAEQTVIIDFWAAWCGPCKMFSPIVDQIAEEHPEIKVGKVNIDEYPSLAIDHKVVSIPTLLVFKGGEVVKRAVGVQSKADIEAMFV